MNPIIKGVFLGIKKYRALLVVLCLLLTLSLVVTITLARYTPQEEVSLAEMSIQPLVVMDSSLDTTAMFLYDEDGGQSMSLLLSNDGISEAEYKLVLATTLDFGNIAQITLTLEDESYIGIPHTLTEEDDLYHTMGEGYLYRFYDEEAQGEKIFSLEAEGENQLTLNITKANSGLVQLQIIT